MGTITTFPTAPLGYTPINTLAYAQEVMQREFCSVACVGDWVPPAKPWEESA